MNQPSLRSISLAVVTLVGVVALACAGSEAPEAPADPTPAQAAAQASNTPRPRPTTTRESVGSPTAPEPVADSAEYDPNLVMYELFPWFSPTAPRMSDALAQITKRTDRSLVPVLVEIMRFMPLASSRERIGSVLRDVTGQRIQSNDWGVWMEWLGRNLDSYQPPSRYVDWKSDMMESLDLRFGEFLRPAREFSRIDLTEVVWGGVLPDGIPDLVNPTVVTAAETDYLNGSDRVFGVTINGESRAYPLRIVNAHEMVNDIVGSEPISLVW